MKTNFPIARLGDHVRQISRRNKGRLDVDVYSVTNSGGFTLSTEYFSKEVFSKDVSNYKIVQKGQFAYNPSRINVGSIDYLQPVDNALVSPLYIVFETDAEILPDYLLRYLKGDWGHAQICANTEGAVRDSLKYRGLEKIKIPLPILDDQKRIVHLLGKVERIIAQRKQHLQQLDDLLSSVFWEMFSDDLRDEKSYLPITEVCDFIDYRGKTPPRTESGIALISAKCVRRGYFDVDRLDYVAEETYDRVMTRGFPKPNDVLFTTEGATFGYTCRIPRDFEKFSVGQRLITMQCKDGYQPEVLEFVLNSQHIQNKLANRRSGSAALGIRSAELVKIHIPFPDRALQSHFSAIVEKVEGLKFRYQKSLTGLEDLYGALSQKTFKGELDLSRIPLPMVVESEVKLHEEVTIEKRSAEESLFFNLPNATEYPLSDLENRREIIKRAFYRLVHNSGAGEEIKLAKFWDNLYWESGDHAGEGDLPFHVKDYDYLKQLLFDAIRGGKIEQTRDRLELGGDEELGNKIVLKQALQS